MLDTATQRRLATLEAEVATLRRQRIRRADWRNRMPLALVALLLALVPLSLLAATPFNDLNAGSVHNTNIDAIYNAGITTGCDPNVSYCPNGLVTREEMASFLARTAGLGGNPPVAHARTAQSADQATNATNAQSAVTAQSAGNATTVGGYASSGLVRASRANGSVNTATASSVVVLTLAITAPAPGVAIVTVGLRGDALNTGGTCPCKGVLLLRHVQADRGAPTASTIAIASNTDPAANADSASLSYAFPVAAGENTFQVTVRRSVGTATVIFYGRGTVLYVPFAQGGGTTLQP